MAGRPKKVQPENLEPSQPLQEESTEITETTPLQVQNPVLDNEPEEPAPPQVEQRATYRVEASSEGGSVAAKHLPNINSGVCEWCGGGRYDKHSPQRLTEDWTVDPDTQIGKCEHYKGVKIRCVYCPLSANFVDNIKQRKHMVWESPWEPGAIIICCSDMLCRDKHLKRAKGGR